MFWENEKCCECEEPVNSENGYHVKSVLWEEVDESGDTTWGEDISSFCSLDCLFKWAWEQMIPKRIMFNMEIPLSVVDVVSELTWKDIAKRRHELLKSIGVKTVYHPDGNAGSW